MTRVIPTPGTLAARIEGIDLSRSLADAEVAPIREVMILSNVVEHGRAIGLEDGGGR